MLEPQLLDIMIVQFRNEKVSNIGSIPITIDCNVVAFIAFEEGFHQPKKRTKHPRGPRPTVSISEFMSLATEVHEQMFRSSDPPDVKSPVFSSRAKPWHSFIDKKGEKTESTLPRPGFEP
ncbi:hypothetical protein TNCV_1741271 [Trichonephila clavipes]|uniref:Uncharacterized protein n=1 Tax=Trichonephila clavipes TaxID=2585209 RepID=A0A8X6V1Y7_TRICX|nr:hypothetical protein TNCV_1741271 [Trichonephila clavipes]